MHCDNISYDYAYENIKHVHRESPKDYRKGKRHIFAAFHWWDLCQEIQEKLKWKCIQEPEFKICADRKYGPRTMKGRNLQWENEEAENEWDS